MDDSRSADAPGQSGVWNRLVELAESIAVPADPSARVAAIHALLRAAIITRIALASGVVLATGCSRLFPLEYVRVQTHMNWECVPELSRADYPAAQAVRLRYVEDPRYGEVVIGKALCDQLIGAGRPVVLVDFEVWGNSSRGLVGFRQIAIDQRVITHTGIGARSFFDNQDLSKPASQHPLSTRFQ